MNVTQELYKALGGEICPHCGCKYEVWREVDYQSDPGFVYLICHCSNCKGYWEEEYHLAGFNKKGKE